MLNGTIIQRINRTINNSSVVVKSFIFLIVLLYAIGLISPVFNALSLSPALLLPPNFRVWTLITGLPIEASFLNLLIDIPVIVTCGMYLEPVWGAMELLKFIAITGIGTAILTSFVSLAAYAITHNYTFWFVRYSGLAGVLGGITVAFKQLLPAQKLNLNFKQLEVQELPFVTMVTFVLFSAIHVFAYTQAIMVICGISVGWIYLRFYQSRGNGTRGDMNESFAAATLFPRMIRPPVSEISDVLFNIAVSAGLCRQPVRTYDVGGSSAIIISLAEGDITDAERRRKKAIRALNQRLEICPELKEHEENSWLIIEDESNKVQHIDQSQLIENSTVENETDELPLPLSSPIDADVEPVLQP